MKELREIDNFGGIDADTDSLLDECFENHEAYLKSKAHDRFLVLGRKGSGKTAIFRKFISTRDYSAGRLHDNSLSEQHLLQVGVVPSRGEAFVLDADLERVVVLQQAQRRPTEDAEVRVGMAPAQAGLVFLKRDVELPMQTVFDGPMTPDCSGELPGGEVSVHRLVVSL